MKYCLFIITFLSFLPFAQAQDKNKTEWQPADIINTERIGSPTFSPDGQMIVWTKRRASKEKDRFVNDLYLTRLNKMKDGMPFTVQLTRTDDSDYSPMFAADGETIYFLSSREEGDKLWALSIYGGEAEEIHEFKNGISDIKWLNDSTLTFTADEGKTLYDQQMKEKKDNTVVVEDSVHWNKDRVFAFDIENKSIKRLTDDDYPVGSYAVSQDGKWLAVRLTMSRHYAADANPDPTFWLYNLETGEKQEIMKGLQTPGNMQFTADNQGFYFTAELSSDPEWNGAGITELYFFDLGEMAHQKMDIAHEWGIGRGYELVGNDLIVSLANGATNQLAFYTRNGNRLRKSSIDLGDKNEHVSIATVSKAGTKVAYQHSTASQLPTYWVADLSKKGSKISFESEQELVKLNEKLTKKPKAKSEVMKWKGYQGDEVTGILYYPKDYKEGEKYPLVVSIHGGPSGVDLDEWSDSWAYMPNIYSEKGAFILMPNYHGSSNHGLKFVESIKKNYYDPELEDITKGIEVLAEKGMIDKGQMAVTGWSNGAILATMLTVRYPDMFKAAAPGAGDVNWTSDFGTCRFGVSFDQSYFGGAPWDDTNGQFFNEAYIRYSPLFEMEKVKTPTLIFHGSEDRAVPRDQGWEYYRALQQTKNAPVRFLWFPGQPHGLQKITHQTRKMQEEIDWLDRYLFETYEAENEAFKEDSPLAMLMKKEKITSENGLFGVMKDDRLIPETVAVKEDSIAFGRFEVTNAQYAAYDQRFLYPANQGNYPAVVNAAQAQAYLKWLGEFTGETYRLPTEAEAKQLHKKAKSAASKENSLRYWAGYAITLPEVKTFKQKIAGNRKKMLMEVGHFAPVKIGDAELYDLGGNVAERYGDGKQVYGFSAADFADPASDELPEDPEIVGFRVVKE